MHKGSTNQCINPFFLTPQWSIPVAMMVDISHDRSRYQFNHGYTSSQENQMSQESRRENIRTIRTFSYEKFKNLIQNKNLK